MDGAYCFICGPIEDSQRCPHGNGTGPFPCTVATSAFATLEKTWHSENDLKLVEDLENLIWFAMSDLHRLDAHLSCGKHAEDRLNAVYDKVQARIERNGEIGRLQIRIEKAEAELAAAKAELDKVKGGGR